MAERAELYHAIPSPGENTPHDWEACTYRQLCTYGGGGWVGGEDITGGHVMRTLPDVCWASIEVATGEFFSRSDESGDTDSARGEDGKGQQRGLGREKLGAF